MAKNNRKHGRNQTFCKAYKTRGTEALNKAKNIEREKKKQAKAKAKKQARLAKRIEQLVQVAV